MANCSQFGVDACMWGGQRYVPERMEKIESRSNNPTHKHLELTRGLLIGRCTGRVAVHELSGHHKTISFDSHPPHPSFCMNDSFFGNSRCNYAIPFRSNSDEAVGRGQSGRTDPVRLCSDFSMQRSDTSYCPSTPRFPTTTVQGKLKKLNVIYKSVSRLVKRKNSQDSQRYYLMIVVKVAHTHCFVLFLRMSQFKSPVTSAVNHEAFKIQFLTSSICGQLLEGPRCIFVRVR